MNENGFVPLVNSMKMLEKDIKGRENEELRIGNGGVNEDSLE